MISIIIPTYNEEKFIGKTLSDLKEKLTLPHEIIITDDKSLDSTVEIARRYVNKVLVPEKKHISIAANRNEGASHASGEFFVFMDSDSTIADPNRFFTEALSRFEKDPNLVALTGRIGVWKELETTGDRIVYSIFNLVHHIKNNWLHVGEASGKFQMMRRRAFEKVGGYREDLITREDADMFIRLAKIGRTYYDHSLVILHTGRRAHRIGWPKLLYIWMLETFWVAAFNKSRVSEWKDVR
ncbi:MAG: glycosyltransferase [Candidatus Taylorbacteria bacterium]|nr:glycosyltransferase [Candidatus Taylorbacteria bacterium]